jgi:UDP-GlcNAc:undecaprenyl-phosphate GlcNAc-1-phosphate transferase
MLLGLLLAYGPISSTDSLDPALLTNYAQSPTLDRFPTILPLLVPAAIFIIPYADLMFAVIRRTRAGKPIMAADRQHLHHRLLNIGHSYRQSVLIMYLWAALFSVTVVSLSIVRSPSAVFFGATLVAVLALLPATMPRLRPWRPARTRAAPAVVPTAARVPAASVHAAEVPAALPLSGAAVNGTTPSGHGAQPGYARDPASFRDPSPFPGASRPPSTSAVPAETLPRAGRLPGADPFPGQPPFTGQSPFTGQPPFPAAAEPGDDPADGRGPFPQAQRPDPRSR